MDKSTEPLVSIIIPTLNSAGYLDALLRSIEQQSYSSIEVIVVDAGSTDNSIDIARRYKAIVIEDPGSRMAAKNLGARQARGEYLYFVDSDMELTPSVVAECVKACEEDGLDALTLPERSVGLSFWAKCRALEKTINDDDPFKSGCRFMKKEVFFAVGGYDENIFFAEDFNLHWRIKTAGYREKLLRSAFVFHHEEERLLTMLKKQVKYSQDAPRYIAAHRGQFFKQFFIFRPAWFKNYSLMLKDPFHAAGMVFMKLAQYTAALLSISSAIFSKPKKAEA